MTMQTNVATAIRLRFGKDSALAKVNAALRDPECEMGGEGR